MNTTAKKTEKIWWLFTTNCLKPYKQYFDNPEDAYLKLKEIIEQSTPEYKKYLQDESEREIRLNEENKDSVTWRVRYQAQEKFAKWKAFTERELETSITLLEIKDLKDKEKIFHAEVI